MIGLVRRRPLVVKRSARAGARGLVWFHPEPKVDPCRCPNPHRSRPWRWGSVAGVFRSGASTSCAACSTSLVSTWPRSPAAIRITRAGTRATRCRSTRGRRKSRSSGAMLGFPGEDYTTPQTIQATGGFGDPSTRAERLDRLRWGVDRTAALGLTDLMLHAGFLPEPDDPGRSAMLDTLAQAGRIAAERGVTLAFETGQETADLLRRTLDDLRAPNLKVNFDPANMLLYDMGDPIQAVERAWSRYPERPSSRTRAGRERPASGARKCRSDRARSISPGSSSASRHRLPGSTGRRARGRRPDGPAPRRGPGPGVCSAAASPYEPATRPRICEIPWGGLGKPPKT